MAIGRAHCAEQQVKLAAYRFWGNGDFVNHVPLG